MKKWTVHPHGCGEHPVLAFPTDFPYGSSPRVWGTSDPEQYFYDYVGFIPTGVGNILYTGFLPVFPAVHPHGCGEHKKREENHESLDGSSPRVWGT